MHLPCPLGQFPWKRYFSPLHILYTVCSSYPHCVPQLSACGLNGLHEKKWRTNNVFHVDLCATQEHHLTAQSKSQTLRKWSYSSYSSMGLRLEPQFTQLS